MQLSHTTPTYSLFPVPRPFTTILFWNKQWTLKLHIYWLYIYDLINMGVTKFPYVTL